MEKTYPDYVETADEKAGFDSLPEHEQANQIFQQEFAKLGVKFAAHSIPKRSESRGFADENWNKTASHAHCLFTFANGESYSCEYSAGVGAAFGKLTLSKFRELCGKGFEFGDGPWQIEHAWKHCKGGRDLTIGGEKALNAARAAWTPAAIDVFESIVRDGTNESFEDYCSNWEMDTDSKRAEKVWNTCREIDRVLTRALGAAKYEQLRELANQL